MESDLQLEDEDQMHCTSKGVDKTQTSGIFFLQRSTKSYNKKRHLNTANLTKVETIHLTEHGWCVRK